MYVPCSIQNKDRHRNLRVHMVSGVIKTHKIKHSQELESDENSEDQKMADITTLS